jgi:hypothetical protein
VPHYSAFIYNDGLGFLASTAALVAGALALRRGPTGWRLLGLGSGAAAAALTRAQGLALVGVAGLVAVVAVWLHGRQAPLRRLLAAAAAGALVGGAALASSLWFFLRNRALYGQLTGSQYNQTLFGFPAQNQSARLVTSPRYVLDLFDGLWVWTRFPTRQVPVQHGVVLVSRVIALAALAGLAVAAARGLHRLGARPAAMGPGDVSGRSRVAGARRAQPGGVASPLMLVGWLVLAFLMVAWYDGNGGHTHARYLLPAIGVVAIGAAVGLDALPGARRLTTLAVSVALLALTGLAWSRFVAEVAHAGITPPSGPRAVADLLHQHGVAHPWVLLAAAALTVLAGLALQQGGLWLLATEAPRERPALPPTDARPEPVAHL